MKKVLIFFLVVTTVMSFIYSGYEPMFRWFASIILLFIAWMVWELRNQALSILYKQKKESGALLEAKDQKLDLLVSELQDMKIIIAEHFPIDEKKPARKKPIKRKEKNPFAEINNL